MFNKYKFDNLDIGNVKDKIVSFSYTNLEDEPSMIHSHRYFEIIIPITFNGMIVGINNKIISAKDHVYIVPNDISHTEKNISKDEHFSYFTLKIKDYINVDRTNILSLKLDTKIYSLIVQRLKNAYEQASSNTISESCLYLDTYLVYQIILDVLKENGYEITSSNFVHYSSFILEVMNYLNKNYKEDIKMDDLALKFGLSRSSLEKKFKQEAGVTPKQYLINIRLDTAKYLLTSSNFSINQITSLCGFFSTAYFVHFFRISTGQTPKEYRKKNFQN